MATFGWISERRQPPPAWDLRLTGWSLCDAGCTGTGFDALALPSACRHLSIVDAAVLTQPQRLHLTETCSPAWRLLPLGVEQAGDRAELICAGCADALPAAATLRELDARARRAAGLFHCLPRCREAGPLLLDLFHRDGRIGRRWLGLHPREFSLLWRLAAQPGERVTRRQLLHDVWRLDHDPETNSLEVHVSRLRAKLARLGCVSLVETVAEGGYRLSAPGAALAAAAAPPPACCAGSDPRDQALVAADSGAAE